MVSIYTGPFGELGSFNQNASFYSLPQAEVYLKNASGLVEQGLVELRRVKSLSLSMDDARLRL